MGIQSFFKQRKPRQFNHKPIYWDAHKEALDKRVERIRTELIASGEIENEQSEYEDESFISLEKTDSDMKARIREGLRQGTEHLQKQHDRGVTAYSRAQRIVRLILMLLALITVLWLMYRGSLDFLI